MSTQWTSYGVHTEDRHSFRKSCEHNISTIREPQSDCRGRATCCRWFVQQQGLKNCNASMERTEQNGSKSKFQVIRVQMYWQLPTNWSKELTERSVLHRNPEVPFTKSLPVLKAIMHNSSQFMLIFPIKKSRFPLQPLKVVLPNPCLSLKTFISIVHNTELGVKKQIGLLRKESKIISSYT